MTNLLATTLALIIAAENATDTTVSKSGAVGRYQIKSCVIADVNRIYGTHFEIGHMTSPGKSKAVAELFLKHQIKLGIHDPHTLARVWACGRHNAIKHHAGSWYVARAILKGKKAV